MEQAARSNRDKFPRAPRATCKILSPGHLAPTGRPANLVRSSGSNCCVRQALDAARAISCSLSRSLAASFSLPSRRVLSLARSLARPAESNLSLCAQNFSDSSTGSTCCSGRLFGEEILFQRLLSSATSAGAAKTLLGAQILRNIFQEHQSEARERASEGAAVRFVISCFGRAQDSLARRPAGCNWAASGSLCALDRRQGSRA